MNTKIKKNLLLFTSVGVVMAGLIFLGLQTNMFGLMHDTGILDPEPAGSVEVETAKEYPEADLQLNLLNSKGEAVSLEDFRGKVIFINLWATWCPPCIAEMPDIENLYRDLGDDGDFVFIMLSLDHRFQKAVDFVEKNNYSFEIYETVKGMPDMYYTQSIPTTFVINAGGKLVLTHIGMGDFDTTEFRNFLLAQK